MLNIRGIKIVVNTVNGLYYTEFKFNQGLNIVRGDNTSGKSTLFQAILYGLGLEEILEGKNHTTMQSVLKDSVEYPKDKLHKIIESYLLLEISNGKPITIKRNILNENVSPKLLEIFEGSLLVDNEANIDSTPMWVHDKGGASNAKHGFHAFLANYLDFDVPEIYYTNGSIRMLYIQTIFPAFLIEQKKGWSDFLMTIPFYGIKDVKTRVIEFILGLDVFHNSVKKSEINNDKNEIINKWKYQRNDILDKSLKGFITVKGIPVLPEIMDDDSNVTFTILENNRKEAIEDYISSLFTAYDSIVYEPMVKNSKNFASIESNIREKQNELDSSLLNADLLSRRLRIESTKVESYKSQLIDVRDELQQNKDALKIYKLGSDLKITLAASNCPTCLQPIKDSLLPQSTPHTPMRVDENIKYLNAQEKMIISYILGEEARINTEFQELALYQNKITSLRSDIRLLKKDLIMDDRIPSISKIEEKVKLKSKIDFYTKLREELTSKTEDLLELAVEWKEILKEDAKLVKDVHSDKDLQKIKKLELYFKELISQFGYTSKPLNDIKISSEKYLPVVENDIRSYDIRYDSSASDLVRFIWSYTCSLYRVSKEFGANHPGLLMFDEPAQHSMSNLNFSKFLLELETYTEAQSIVFASFNNSDQEFNETTSDLNNFNLIRITDKLIMPVKEASV